MNAYDMVQLTLLAMDGEIKGKTKLQKIMYFVGVLTDSLEELGFRPHFYGPFSSDVAGAVDRLRGLGFVDQNVSRPGGVDNSGFEVVRYDFRLNDDGKQVAEAKSKKAAEDWNKIQQAVRALKKTKEEDYFRLSIAAKTYFMMGEHKEKARKNDLVALAGRFGWSVTPDQVEQAGKFLEELGLIEIAQE